MEQKEMETKAAMENAFSILGLLFDRRLEVSGPGETGRYTLTGAVPEGAEGLLEALEGMDSLRVPAARLGKDLRRFLKERDLTGGGLLLLARLRQFVIRQEGPDAYEIMMDRRFQETVPMPEVRLEHLIAALRRLDGQKGLFSAPVRRVYRSVELPGILLEAVRPAALKPAEVLGLPVEGKVFVLAGGLNREDRARAKELISAQGGRCTSSLSGKTDYLAAGGMEKLRENTLMQLRALQAKGRDVRLLDTASLFALLGDGAEKAQSEAFPAVSTDDTHTESFPAVSAEDRRLESFPAVSPKDTHTESFSTVSAEDTRLDSFPAASPKDTHTESFPAVFAEDTRLDSFPAASPKDTHTESFFTVSAEDRRLESFPAASTEDTQTGTLSAEAIEEKQPEICPSVFTNFSLETKKISGNISLNHEQEMAVSHTESSSPTAVPADETDPKTEVCLAAETSSTVSGREPAALLPAEPLRAFPRASEAPEAAESPKDVAAEGMQAALEQGWKEAWESTMESARAAEEKALAEIPEQIRRLREARAAEEGRLQKLGLLKFGERAAVRQEIQRLNQALRSAEAELARLTAGLERTAT